MRAVLLVVTAAACTASTFDAREQRVLQALRDDNYVWVARDPGLVGMKLRKMQRGPYDWLRGTAGLYWRDAMEPGAPRAVTAFGDPRASRVLLVGDPHPENVGTYRAADGTMFVDWNDFDGSGYGPFTGDLRRLGAGLAIIADGDPIAEALVRRAATGYARQIAELATGVRVAPVLAGAHRLLDQELDKAERRGDARLALDELAPVTGGVRVLARGDLEPVAPDGVLEDRVLAVGAEQRAWLERAIAGWRGGRLDPEAAVIKLAARRIGSGVASYAAYRFNVVLEGASADVADDDVLVELKETRDGLVVRGLPQREAAEWSSPAARAADTQRRLHARPDGDPLLGHALVGGLSLKLRDREAYQRGLDREDLAALMSGDDAARDELLALAELLGAMLARAHGQARTADDELGWAVIAPLLAGREAAFADELAQHALDDAALTIADHAAMEGRDLLALIGAP